MRAIDALWAPGSYLRKSRLALALIVAGSVLEMAFNALVPLSFKSLIDRALPEANRAELTSIVLFLVLGLVVVSLAALGRDRLYARVASGTLADLRYRMFNQLQFLSMDYYARTEVGDILARFSTDMASIEQCMTLAIPWGLVPALEVVVGTALLFALDWHLALVAMLVWPFALAGPRFFAPRATEASDRRKEDEAGTITAIQENVGAQGLVKAFGLERRSLTTFHRRNTQLLGSTARLSFLSAMMERSAGIGILILQVLIISLGALMAFEGRLTIGTLVSFQSLFLLLSFGLYNVAQFLPTVVTAGASLRRIQALLRETPQVHENPDARLLPRLTREIALHDVSFGYAAERVNLRQISLRIPQGWSVAFVGASGSGKSTLLNLLMRFYDPTTGAITFDGEDVRGTTLESLRSQIGIVFQDNVLFNTSIRDNIRLGRLDATDLEVEAAAREAEIHEFVMTLPDGYETLAGERGGRFSGGQRQRIAIARAILRRPAVLLLDEATSALDVGTESAINETLARVARGCTTISVTHRLSSVVAADCVYVLQDGAVAEHGSHDELLARDGVYAAMWRKQSGFVVRADAYARIEPGRLRSIPTLGLLTPEMLADIAPFFVTEFFPEGRTIVHQGDPGDKFYIIARGEVEVTRDDGSGDSRRIAVLQDGDHFGEIALLENTPRTASVRAVVPCLCLALHRGTFIDLLAKVPDLREQVVGLARERRATLVQSSGLVDVH